MDVANLNPMIAPVQAVEAVQPVQSGGGGTFIYVIVVIVLLVSLIAAGYFFYKSQSQEVVDLSKYAGPSPGPPSSVGPSPDVFYGDIVNVEPLDIEPETITITDEGSAVENYIIMPDNIDYEYQTYAYNPKDTDINGSVMTFDKETNKCPDGTLDCLYYTRVDEGGRVTSISDKDEVDLIHKFMDDLWDGKLLLLETSEKVEMTKAYELNDKRQLMRDGKVIKPGVDLNVGQYLLIFGVMYKETGLPRPNIVYNFLAKKVGDVTEDVSSVEKEMGDLESEVEQKPQTETPTPASPSIEQEPQTETPTLNDIIENITLTSPSVEQETPTPASPSVEQETPTLNDISAKITFVSPSPSVEQETPTLDDVQTQVELVTPVVTTTPKPTLGNIRERVKL